MDSGLKRSACSYPLVAQGPACHYGRSWAQGSCSSAPSYPHFRDGCQHSLLSFQIIPAPAPTPTQNEKACLRLRLRLRLAPLSPPIHSVLNGDTGARQWTPTGKQTEEQVSEIMPLSLTLKIVCAGLALLSWHMRRLNILPSPVSVLKT